MAKNQENAREKRRFPRVTAPVYFRSPRMLTPKRPVCNISIGGVRIYSDEYLKVGKRLELEFFLPDGNSITAVSRVVWITETPINSKANYDVGLEFIDFLLIAVEQLKKVLDKSY